jgi:serine/threonine protein kinase
MVDTFRGIMDGAVEEDQDAAAAEFIMVLTGRCNSQTAHAELAGLVRFIGATVASVSRGVFDVVSTAVTRALCRGVASEVASVTVAASTAVRVGLVPFAAAEAFAIELPAVVRALVREGRQHWDVDAALELGQTWRELQDAVGVHRWAAAVDSVVNVPGASAEVREYPAKLLARCDEVEAQRAADASSAESRRSEAVAVLGAKSLRRLDFVFGRELGAGAFASVRFAKFIEPEIAQAQWLSVAVKSVSKSVMCLSEEGAAALEREARLHAELTQDPATRRGIVQLYGRFDDGAHSLCFVQELGTHGDLHSAVSVSGIAHEPARGVLAVKGMHGWIRRVLLHVHATLSRMHAVGIMYGDLKPENVLVAADGAAKLCDFGSAMRLDDMCVGGGGGVSLGGTLHFLPPEALAANGTTSALDGRAVDWWSFAVTTVFALTGHHVVDDADTTALRLKIRRLTSRDAVRAALLDAIGAAAVAALPGFVIDVLSMTHEVRAADGGRAIASDPFFADSAPPFSGQSAPMPARLRVTAAGSAPSSGRKQSVMWRRHAGADTSTDSVSLALDVLSGERAMPAEVPGTPAIFTFTPFALNNPKAKEPAQNGGGYMTVMPPQRR